MRCWLQAIVVQYENQLRRKEIGIGGSLESCRSPATFFRLFGSIQRKICSIASHCARPLLNFNCLFSLGIKINWVAIGDEHSQRNDESGAQKLNAAEWLHICAKFGGSYGLRPVCVCVDLSWHQGEGNTIDTNGIDIQTANRA